MDNIGEVNALTWKGGVLFTSVDTQAVGWIR
jgi:hypothetical protein